ncbi:MAG: hypothetical protein JNM42_00920 [Propionivibrio sp.]|uniref:hypothetical protein n=1 Tax=Propionivibrio sp. TaxID=2212460 RepID=UPI001A3CE6B0|nr:hypothetical protein [Propionivibrio sp.]MBL8412983.1 hypothetical protein [Propionivibrio sp.]
MIKRRKFKHSLPALAHTSQSAMTFHPAPGAHPVKRTPLPGSMATRQDGVQITFHEDPAAAAVI